MTVAVVLVALSSSASAEERITDGTAFALEPGDVRVGLLRSGVGLPVPEWLDSLELSTYPVPWAAYLASSDALGVQFVNGQLKGSRAFGDGWTGALTLAALYGSVGDADTSGRLVVLPFEAHLNRQLTDRLSVGALVQLTHVALSGNTASESDPEMPEAADEPGRYSADAAVRTSTAHLGVTTELRVAGWMALIGEARVTRFGRVSADGSGSYVVDENTMVEVFGEASGSAASWGYSVRALTHLTLGWANLRLGVSVGNYVLPMLNLAVPVRYVMPTANLYLRF